MAVIVVGWNRFCSVERIGDLCRAVGQRFGQPSSTASLNSFVRHETHSLRDSTWCSISIPTGDKRISTNALKERWPFSFYACWQDPTCSRLLYSVPSTRTLPPCMYVCKVCTSTNIPRIYVCMCACVRAAWSQDGYGFFCMNPRHSSRSTFPVDRFNYETTIRREGKGIEAKVCFKIKGCAKYDSHWKLNWTGIYSQVLYLSVQLV